MLRRILLVFGFSQFTENGFPQQKLITRIGAQGYHGFVNYFST